MKEIDLYAINPKTGKNEHILAKRLGKGDWFIQANPFSGFSGEILKEYFDKMIFIQRADHLCDDSSCRGYIYHE